MSSGVTISGAVSGLDTASLINQFVQVQQNQQTLLKTQQAGVQKTSDAYGTLIGQLKTLSTLTADLAKTSTWQGTVATSSDTSVTATSTSNLSSAITFDVTDIARAHALISTSTYGSLNDVVASGTLTLHNVAANTDTTISVGTGSLTDVVNAINTAGTGYTAAAVRTGTGQYRLQVSAAGTGAGTEFTLGGTGTFPATGVLTQGTDAAVHVGTGAGAYDATSSTNTFSSLVPGLSFTVSKPNVNGVTVSSSVDGTAIATKVQKMVDAANTALKYVSQQTAYDATTRSGGPLLGEASVRALQQNILSAVSTTGAAGVHVTRDGTISFDQTEFTKAYKADPVAVAAAFGAKGTTTVAAAAPSTAITFAGSTDATRAGTYAIDVTAAAARESWSINAPLDGMGVPVVSGHTFKITRGTTSISYLGQLGDTLGTVVTELNKAAANAGLDIATTAGATSLTFAAGNYGTAGAFTATLDNVNGTRVTAGANVAGTINGETATGLGNVLSLTSGTTPAVGLSVQVSTTAADIAATGSHLGTLTYQPGLAQRLTTLLNDATNSTTGMLTSAQQGRQAAIKDLQDQIDAWNSRLSAYRETLTRQFTVMETTLAQLKSSMTALSGLTTNSSNGDDNT